MNRRDVAVIRAWTEYGYDSVPYFELYSDDPEVTNYDMMECSGHLPDRMMVLVGGYFRTNWGWYVHVEKFTDELIKGGCILKTCRALQLMLIINTWSVFDKQERYIW